jgi:hypothetical protein
MQSSPSSLLLVLNTYFFVVYTVRGPVRGAVVYDVAVVPLHHYLYRYGLYLNPGYELFGRGHGPSKLRSMLLVVVICNPV